jgi:hypothetical protein
VGQVRRRAESDDDFATYGGGQRGADADHGVVDQRDQPPGAAEAVLQLAQPAVDLQLAHRSGAERHVGPDARVEQRGFEFRGPSAVVVRW